MTMKTETCCKWFRESLYLWLNLIAVLIYRLEDHYEYSPEYFSTKFFESLYPVWLYNMNKGYIATVSEPLSDDDIPF